MIFLQSIRFGRTGQRVAAGAGCGSGIYINYASNVTDVKCVECFNYYYY